MTLLAKLLLVAFVGLLAIFTACVYSSVSGEYEPIPQKWDRESEPDPERQPP